MSQPTESEVVEIILRYLEGLFPRHCSKCQRRFTTLREYLLTTEQLGSAVSYDLEIGDWAPANPLGTLTFANCPCGNTLALSSENMRLSVLLDLYGWARVETQKRNQTPHQLLNYLREQVWKRALSSSKY